MTKPMQTTLAGPHKPVHGLAQAGICAKPLPERLFEPVATIRGQLALDTDKHSEDQAAPSTVTA